MRTILRTKTGFMAFTLIELMVVILIVGVLAAAVIPILRAKVDRAKWAEANATAGMIQNAVKMHYAETGNEVTGNLAEGIGLSLLDIETNDLAGTYFTAADYTIDSVNSDGLATITVTGSLPQAPDGSKILSPDGSWE